MNFKQEKGEGFAEVFIVLVVLFVLVVLGIGLWHYIHKSVLREVIFWLVIASPFVVWLIIKFRDDIGYFINQLYHEIRKSKSDDSNLSYDTKYIPQEKEDDNDTIGEHIDDALEIMDYTHKWYNDEEEANRELVSVLKAQGLNDVVYQHNLSNGRTVDIKIGDVIIECKLSPDTSDVDRLIGQLREYTKHSDEVHVVIFGQLDSNAKERIEDEIEDRYKNHVFLNYLDSPKRQRRG